MRGLRSVENLRTIRTTSFWRKACRDTRELHEDSIAQWLQDLGVEGLGGFVVLNRKRRMVDWHLGGCLLLLFRGWAFAVMEVDISLTVFWDKCIVVE